MKTESQSAPGRIHRQRQQRIARRSSQALADPVGKAQQQEHRPGSGEGQQRARDRSQRIAADHPGLGRTSTIREHSGKEFEQTTRCFSNSLDDAQRLRAGHQCRGEVDRQQRVDQFAGGIVEKTHQAEQPDGSWQFAQASEHVQGCRVNRQSSSQAGLWRPD